MNITTLTFTGIYACMNITTLTFAGIYACMNITTLTFAGICLFANSWFPWEIIVEILTMFAVETLGVVCALTTSVNHVGSWLNIRKRQAA
jgi:hypothetical protein